MSTTTHTELKNTAMDALDWIDLRVKAFESHWRADAAIQLEQYLQDAGELRLPLLTELLHVDLEFRLRSGQPAGVENYLNQYSELSDDSAAVAELVLHELRIRQSRQPNLTLDQLLLKFPALAKAVQASPELTIDVAVADESTLEVSQPAQWPTLPGYEFKQVLGRGGMGIVYLALDLQLKREVAIKMLLKGALATPQEQSRFRREAEAVAALHHPQVLQVYQIGEHLGQPYLVLEYAPGGSLNRQLGGRPIEAHRAAEIMQGLAHAIAVAHAANIIHRDLKPANVLLDARGLPKIADFGLAKRVSLDAEQTEDDLLVCTPCYAAPERIFEPENGSSPRVDVYSLGAILFEMLTGRPPFVGTSILEVLEQARCGDAITPRRLVSSVPRDLETICLKCLERDPSRRYATAADLANDIGRFLDHQPVLARPIAAPARLLRWVRRNPTIAALASISALLLLGVTAASLGIATVLARSSVAERELRALAVKAEELAVLNEQKALAEAAAANESLHFIQELFAATDIARITPEDMEVAPDQLVVDVSTREIVDLAIARLNNSLRQHPLARARVLTTVGTTALDVGMVTEARPLLNEAVEIYQHSQQSESMSAAEAMIVLARIEAANRNYEVANKLFDRSSDLLNRLALTESTAQADIAVYRAWMGLAWKNRGFVANCLHDVEKAIEIRSKYFGTRHPQTVLAQTIATLATALASQDRATAVQAMESLWEEIKDVPIGNFMKGIVLDQIASLYQRMEDSAKATHYIELSLDRMHRAIGNHDHPILSEILSDAAWIAHSCGDIRAARIYQEQALRMRERCLGEDQETWDLRVRLIERLAVVGESLLARQIRNDFARGTPPDYMQGYLLTDLLREGHYEEVAPIVQASLADHEAGQWTSMIEHCTLTLAEIELQRGNKTAAIRLYREWCEKEKGLPTDKALPDFVLLPWHQLLERCGAVECVAACQAEFDQVLARYANDLPRFHPDEWYAVYQLILRVGETPATSDVLMKWRDGWLGDNYPKHVCLGGINHALALQYHRAGDLPAAQQSLLQAREQLRMSLGELAPLTVAAEFFLAKVRSEMSEGAIPLAEIQELLEKFGAANGIEHPQYAEFEALLNALVHRRQPPL